VARARDLMASLLGVVRGEGTIDARVNGRRGAARQPRFHAEAKGTL
jgi:hypothetical protein